MNSPDPDDLFVINILYDRVIESVEDRESPFGCVDAIRSDVQTWLESQTCFWDWDWWKDSNDQIEYVAFTFDCARTATLFKLTWGGA